MVALGLSLQALWILALLINRIPAIATWMSFVPMAGPVLGLYSCTAIVYLVTLLVWQGWYHHRDCSQQRPHIVWFICVSFLIFFVMSIPNIFQFTISATS